tara:strand:- start:427 stop:1131 length:705 start_codon:yes stop_codon:yes gene_type:complete
MGLGSSFGITSETNNNIQTNGLVFYVDAAYRSSYPRSGTTITDLVNSKAGTLTNGAAFNSAGYISLDGANDYINFGDDSLFDLGSGAFSITAWINIEGNIGSHWGIASKDMGGSGEGYQFYKTSGNVLAFRQSTDPYHLFYTNETITDSNWHHVVYTADGAGVSEGYIDGETTTYAYDQHDGSEDFDNSHLLKIGVRETNYARGLIGPILFYNRVITFEDVKQNYHAQKERFGY